MIYTFWGLSVVVMLKKETNMLMTGDFSALSLHPKGIIMMSLKCQKTDIDYYL